MKIIDCSASIGLDPTNCRIINHERFKVYERLKQAETSADLIAEMDFNKIDQAVVFHKAMYCVAPDYGNAIFLKDKQNYTKRLFGTVAMLADEQMGAKKLYDMVNINKLFGVRCFATANRYMLDRISCGETFDMLTNKKIPLYLSADEGWETIFSTLKQFPDLTVIITNYGLWGSDSYVYPLIKAYKNVYLDTSDYQLLSGIKQFVNRFGSNRLLFGTNFPCDNMGGPLATLLMSKILQSDIENIAAKNAERLFSEIIFSTEGSAK